MINNRGEVPPSDMSVSDEEVVEMSKIRVMKCEVYSR
jgi:hypothetical protein